jgi:histone deacetylase 11
MKDPIIYSSAYNIAFLGLERLHPFDSSKWGRIERFLVEDGLLDHKRVVEPVEATKEDLLVVHTEGYLESLKRSSTVAVITEVLVFCFLNAHVYSPSIVQVPE